MTAIAISSGHGLYVRGASGDPVPPQMDEVDTARWVVDRVARYLQHAGVTTHVIHDNQSQSQSANLDYIVREHNKTEREIDISVHMNAYDGNAHGCEVLYTSEEGSVLAQELVDAICAAGGFVNRGPKERNDLAFLNGTDETACLIELAFCDHTGDCQKMAERGSAICYAIANVLTDGELIDAPPGIEPPERPEDLPPPFEVLFRAIGKVSHFGGPNDQGVSASEDLAFWENIEDAPAHFFLPFQPEGTTGLARRLNPGTMYCACRWDYDIISKDTLRRPNQYALVKAKKNGKACLVAPVDWGPHAENTDKAIDLSPGAMLALDLESGDEAELIYPAPLELI